MLTVILIEPETAGNIGAVARVMANFGVKDLMLVNPRCELDKEAFDRASHGGEILAKAKIVDEKMLSKFDVLVGTTAKLGSDYNIPRSPITPEEFAAVLNPNCGTGLIFGRESSGLNNKEILLCDFIVAIPTAKNYPTLNLSHAVAIMLYALCKDKENVKSHILPALKCEKQQLWKLFEESLAKLAFTTPQKMETQRRVWGRIFSKSYMSKREAYAVMGFFKKIIKKLNS